MAKQLLERFGYRMFKATNLPQGSIETFCAKLAGRGFQPRRILDVGANRGDWSRAVRSVFPDAIFTLIEPQEEMAPFLDRFCAETPRAHWIMAGAGATEGEFALAVAPDSVSSSFKVSREEADSYGWKTRAVPVVTLDGVCAELDAPPEIVKLDVESYEREVLEGAQTLLGKTEMFLLELALFPFRQDAMVFVEAVDHMRDLGYSVYDFTGFQSRPFDGALALCDVAFVRTEGVLRSFVGWDRYD